jgi:hypothetical protein
VSDGAISNGQPSLLANRSKDSRDFQFRRLLVVPFGFAGLIKAARVAGIAMGRIRLVEHEAKTLCWIGGHAVEWAISKRSKAKRIDVQKVIVVLRHKTYNGMPYYIVTSYLE